MVNILNNMPVWAAETLVASALSVITLILYPIILLFIKKHELLEVRLIKKLMNLLLAFSAWVVLLVEKIQQGLEQAQIPFNESKLFYVAVIAASITLVHTAIEND